MDEISKQTVIRASFYNNNTEHITDFFNFFSESVLVDVRVFHNFDFSSVRLHSNALSGEAAAAVTNTIWLLFVLPNVRRVLGRRVARYAGAVFIFRICCWVTKMAIEKYLRKTNLLSKTHKPTINTPAEECDKTLKIFKH